MQGLLPLLVLQENFLVGVEALLRALRASKFGLLGLLGFKGVYRAYASQGPPSQEASGTPDGSPDLGLRP